MEYKPRKNLIFKLIGIIGVILFFTTPGHACSACFYGDPNQKAIIAVQWGVLSLLAVVVGVLLAFIKFFINFNKRAQLLNKANTI